MQGRNPSQLSEWMGAGAGAGAGAAEKKGRGRRSTGDGARGGHTSRGEKK